MTRINRVEMEKQRANQLRECKRIVWEYRDLLEPYWPCPDIWDSLLFCQTELGEVIDAYLRVKGGYARNNDKSIDMLDEMADLALMAFTALGRDHDEPCGWWKLYDSVFVGKNEMERFANYSYWLADALDKATNFYDDVDAWRQPIVSLLNSIATHPGMDLPTRLTARLERIKAKRMPPPSASLIYKREPTADEVAYARQLESELEATKAQLAAANEKIEELQYERMEMAERDFDDD